MLYFGVEDGKKEFVVDTVRRVIEKASLSPNEASCKIFILKDCQAMNTNAQNALLKIIEDTPKNQYFLLLTTDKTKMLETILSRCVSIDVKGVSDEVGAKYISENVDNVDYIGALELMKQAKGNIGKAISSVKSVEVNLISEISCDICDALVSKNDYELVKITSVFFKSGDYYSALINKYYGENSEFILDKNLDIFSLVLENLKNIFRDVLCFHTTRNESNFISGESDTVKKIAREINKSKILALIGVCDDALYRIKSYGNIAITVTKFCCDLKNA